MLVGRRSYGLYLWHCVVFDVLLTRTDMPRLEALALGVGLSWLLTLASWRFVEQPFLRMKAGGSARPADSIAGPTVTAATPAE